MKPSLPVLKIRGSLRLKEKNSGGKGFTLLTNLGIIVFILLSGLFLTRCGGSTSTQPVTVYYAWTAHPDQTVTKYRVYAGKTLDQVNPITETEKTAVVLSLNPEIVCFRVTALNQDGESPKSEGVCL